MSDAADIFLPEDDEAKARAIAEARAQAATGQTMAWDDVKRWLQSWGKDDELPPPWK